MLKKKKSELKPFDIINLPLYHVKKFETFTEWRPVLIESIVDGVITYRPITKTFTNVNENPYAKDFRVKNHAARLHDWEQAGLTHPSSVNFGIQQTIGLDELPDNVSFRGHLSERDQKTARELDKHLEEYMDIIKNHSHYRDYVETHNKAYEKDPFGHTLLTPKSGKIVIHELPQHKINFDIDVEPKPKTPTVKPVSRSFTNRTRYSDKQNRRNKPTDFEPDY